MKIIGGIVVALGIFLWCGNVFGFFPTIPMLGYGVIVFGGFITKKGAEE